MSLNLESRLSLRQIQRLLKQSFNLSISVGAISDMIKWAAQHTQDAFDELLITSMRSGGGFMMSVPS